MTDSTNRPRWMEELDRRLLRRLHELEQENQQLRKDLTQTKEKLDFVMNEGRRVLTSRMQEVANLKKEVNGLQEQLQQAVEGVVGRGTPADMANRPRVQPPRRPGVMPLAKVVAAGRP